MYASSWYHLVSSRHPDTDTVSIDKILSGIEMTILVISLVLQDEWHYDTQHNDTQHNDK